MQAGYDSKNAVAEAVLTEEEQQLLMQRMWSVLKKEAGRFNGLESTSMSVDRAQDLLESLVFTMRVAMESGLTKKEVLSMDLGQVIHRGQQILLQKKQDWKIAWELLCEDLPKIRNVYYAQTKASIDHFHYNYEIYYEAHHIPCSIDYWLMCPVPETLKGIRYMEEYIFRLQIENDFVNAWDLGQVIDLYKQSFQNYQDAFFNFCEPILTCGIGQVILGIGDLIEGDGNQKVSLQQMESIGQMKAMLQTGAKQQIGTLLPIRPLKLIDSQRERLLGILLPLSETEIKELVDSSVEILCGQIRMTADYEIAYFKQAAQCLEKRLFAAVQNRDISHIF